MMYTKTVATMLALLTLSGMAGAYLWTPPEPAPVLHDVVDAGERSGHGAVDLVGGTGHKAADAADDAYDSARDQERRAVDRAREEASEARDHVRNVAADAEREVQKRVEPIPPESRPGPTRTVKDGVDTARGQADPWTERPAGYIAGMWDRLPCTDHVRGTCRATFW